MTDCTLYDDMDYLSEDDWQEYIKETEECFGWTPTLSDIQEICFDDAMTNLEFSLLEVKSFKAVGSFGLWYGRRNAATCEVDNLKDLIINLGSGFEHYYLTIGIEDNDLTLKYSHHDGTNYFTVKECCIDGNGKEILKKLFENKEY